MHTVQEIYQRLAVTRHLASMFVASSVRCGDGATPAGTEAHNAFFLETDIMLKHQLIHPKINEVLGRAGHHSKVLIADGNYPASSTLGPNAELVSLNLSPGLVTYTQVLQALVTAIPIEVANTMGIPEGDPYALGGDPPVWEEYRQVLSDANVDVALEPIQKWDFYEAVASRDLVLTIQTADQALWANLLLSIGVRKPN